MFPKILSGNQIAYQVPERAMQNMCDERPGLYHKPVQVAGNTNIMQYVVKSALYVRLVPGEASHNQVDKRNQHKHGEVDNHQLGNHTAGAKRILQIVPNGVKKSHRLVKFVAMPAKFAKYLKINL